LICPIHRANLDDVDDAAADAADARITETPHFTCVTDMSYGNGTLSNVN